MKKLAALVFFLFSANSAHAGTAECTQEFPGRVLLESGHRAYALLEALQLKIGSQAMPIQLCVQEGDERSFVAASRRRKTTTIVASRFTFTRFSNAALIGALAHELGHIARNARNPNPNAREREYEDQMADAFAIRLVGTEPLRAAYLAHTNDKAMTERRISRALKLLGKGTE
jgi:Zn-dependent protease with chaperone function